MARNHFNNIPLIMWGGKERATGALLQLSRNNITVRLIIAFDVCMSLKNVSLANSVDPDQSGLCRDCWSVCQN